MITEPHSSFRFFILSDPHLTHPPLQYDTYKLTSDSVTLFEETVQTIQKQGADFLLIPGDIFEARYHAFSNLNLAHSLISKIDLPCRVLMGNHDTKHRSTLDAYEKNDFIECFKGYGPEQGVAYWRHDITAQNITFIGLDTSQSFTSFGSIGEHQKVWLRNTLESIPRERNVFIVMHHPAVVFNEMIWMHEEMKIYLLENAEELRGIFQNYPQVKVVFSGHTHTDGYQCVQGIHYISCPSLVTWPNMYMECSVQGQSFQFRYRSINNKAKIEESYRNLQCDDTCLRNFGSVENTMRYYTPSCEGGVFYLSSL